MLAPVEAEWSGGGATMTRPFAVVEWRLSVPWNRWFYPTGPVE